MWNHFLGRMRSNELPIVTLARNPELDQETAFTICRLINCVGWSLKDDWDWNWLRGEQKDHRSLIDIPLLKKAWKPLAEKDRLSLQTTNDVDKRISTISPLTGLLKLKTLVLQNNLIQDLGPLSGMTKLTYLNCYANKISDLSPLRNLPLLEELTLAHNPVASLRVLENLPNLRELSLSADQIARFAECQRLPSLRSLDVTGNETIADFTDWPDMPLLQVLSVHNAESLRGIERFGALGTLGIYGDAEQGFSDLSPLSGLKKLTHLTVCSLKPLDAEPLAQLHALRRLSINCPRVRGLAKLTSLPVLHEFRMDDESNCDPGELNTLRAGLTPRDTEFRNDARGLQPSLDLHVVDQETFDYYDLKAPFGIRPDECNDGMLASEREWLIARIREAVSVELKDKVDFLLPYTSGRRRSERLILYSVRAYEAFRTIALILQRILCETRNDWIIWFQSCLGEGPEDEEESFEDLENFTVWVYPNKIVATEENAEVVRELIEWRAS
ncbi:MAG: Internalin-A [Pedosphaera sp.]|nr:Internalin-A [Pedosphaera sp.]